MRIFIGADHGGFKLKKQLIAYLSGTGHTVIDCGNTVLDPRDDYPDFAFRVARLVADTAGSRGILICRNGVGVSIVANRHRGVRAVSSSNVHIIRTSRADDDTNVLCLPADFVQSSAAKHLVDRWLQTPFSRAARHQRRLKKIDRHTTGNHV